MTPFKLYFRVDASKDIGTGHLSRCKTIAEAAKTQGIASLFITRRDEETARYLSENGLLHEPITPRDWDDDAQLTCNILMRESVPITLICDHYEIDAHWESKIKPHVRQLAILDDLKNRSHHCDFLIDGAFQVKKGDYDQFVPDYCTKLLGSRYCIMNPLFANAHDNLPKGLRNKNKIHIFFGSTDTQNNTHHYSQLILNNFNDVNLVIATGNYYSFQSSIKELTATFGTRVKWINNTPNLIDSMLECGVALGAPGTTTWERACLGLPSAYLAISQNQKPILEELQKIGFCQYWGEPNKTSDHYFLDQLATFLKDEVRLNALYNYGITAFDGRGAFRVLSELFPVMVSAQGSK